MNIFPLSYKMHTHTHFTEKLYKALVITISYF